MLTNNNPNKLSIMDSDISKLCIVCSRPFGLIDQDQHSDKLSNLSKYIRSFHSQNPAALDVFWNSINFIQEFNRLENSFGLSLCPNCLLDLNEIIKSNENMSVLENHVISLQKQILKGLRDIEECLTKVKHLQEKIRTTVDKSDMSCLERRFLSNFNQLNAMEMEESSNNFAMKLRKWIVTDAMLFTEKRLQGNLSILPAEENRRQVSVKVEEEEPKFDDNDDHFDSNSLWSPPNPEHFKMDLQETTNQKKPRIKYGLRKTSSMTLRTRVKSNSNAEIKQSIITQPPSTKTSLSKSIKTMSRTASSKKANTNIKSNIKRIPKLRKSMSTPDATQASEKFKLYSCQQCVFKTRRIPSFEQHLKEHENPDSKSLLKCSLCPSEFSTNQYLQFHQKLHEDQDYQTVTTPTMRCDICSKFFPILYLPQHIQSHSSSIPGNLATPSAPQKLIFCQSCSFCCTTTKAYLNHLRYHYVSKTARFSCSICSEEFNNPTLLIRHYPLVHEEFKRIIPCDIESCSKTFPCKDTMLEHKRYVHKFKSKSIPCKDSNCDKMFSSVKSMEVHFCIHSGEKPFPCELCGERYIHRDGLRSHQRRVHGAAKLKCEICGKEFLQPRTLKSHVALHENRGVSCETCGMIFGSRKDLKRHLITHSEETRWTCEKCGKGFKSKEGWKDHMAAHEEKKNLKCEYCGKGFVRNSNLREHLRVHTGERPYICDVCGKDFNQASALRIHKRTQHK